MSDRENKKHSFLRTIGTVAAAGTAAYGGFSWHLFNKLFDLERNSLHSVSLRQDGDEEAVNRWLVQAKRTDAYLQSFDGLTLHAIVITNHSEGHRWVLLAHGFGQSAMDMAGYMLEADKRGYNILAIDQRGCGGSRGRYCGMGWLEHYDVISWCSWLCEHDSDCEIALIGVDIGANAVMNAAGDYLSPHVKCGVEDGGCSDLKEELLYLLKSEPDLPSGAFIVGIDFFVKHLLHFSIYEYSTRRQLLTARIPLLFIHGNQDAVVPASMAIACSDACSSRKELALYDQCGHNEAVRQPDYFDKVFGFIETAF